MDNRLETQREWITNRLLTTGQIEAKMVKTQGGKDYLYTLINKDEILANLDKKLQKIGA